MLQNIHVFNLQIHHHIINLLCYHTFLQCSMLFHPMQSQMLIDYWYLHLFCDHGLTIEFINCIFVQVAVQEVRLTYTCATCTTVYTDLNLLTKHITADHPPDITQLKPVSCAHCTKTFVSPRTLEKHYTLLHAGKILSNIIKYWLIGCVNWLVYTLYKLANRGHYILIWKD